MNEDRYFYQIFDKNSECQEKIKAGEKRKFRFFSASGLFRSSAIPEFLNTHI